MDSTSIIPTSAIQNWIPFYQALIWPITALLILFFLRKYIPDLIDRTTKIGALGVAFEFEKAKEFSPKWSNEYMEDIRKGAKSDEFSSGAMDLIQQFNKEGKFDYAIIDLDGGKGWLTSRLFIFSTLLSVLRGIKYWVFVDSYDSISNKYFGYVDSESLRLKLADKFPWLSIAYSESLMEINQGNLDNLDATDSWAITQLIQNFLTRIQKEKRDEPAIDDQDNGIVENIDNVDWVLLKGKTVFEKARFIDINQLRILLGDVIITSSLVDIVQYSKNQIIEKILLNKESLIPLVNSQNYFIEMIDLDHAKKNILERKKSSR
jgi:hypothetical protein